MVWVINFNSARDGDLETFVTKLGLGQTQQRTEVTQGWVLIRLCSLALAPRAQYQNLHQLPLSSRWDEVQVTE